MKHTDAEIKQFIAMFGDKLPNPTQSPKQFEFYIKMFKFITQQQHKESNAVSKTNY